MVQCYIARESRDFTVGKLTPSGGRNKGLGSKQLGGAGT